ncbi:MAG: 1-deoxy-D-xylulose-5-phosphate reductoisomerase [Erysipelotrichaceae bacterium]|jgi:1-deoxy-D-xylulose-5-phosphate reductoisomerase|nr:1-deoxy-D-xylulose-5-phosphate reductoisomerase [Erysipelotrichaceae bacterium]
MMSVCLLGASGSIGTQTIDVMLKNPLDFRLVAFSVGHKTRKIARILRLFPTVRAVAIQESKHLAYYQNRYPQVAFYCGEEGLIKIIEVSEADMVVNALVGFVGLKPTIVALKNNKIVCLSNKESLVVGGEIINNLLNKGHGKLYPIDSEHVAIAKCLAVDNRQVDQVLITASGGAFRNLSRSELVNVTPEQALLHPNWKMGNKITIDSATMVNKAFEIIEAHYLFNLKAEKISPIINLNSYVHSLVRYNDGSYRMEIGKPDMRKPIKYALYQGLIPYQTVVVNDLADMTKHVLYPFDKSRFPIIDVAYRVIKEKGTLGAVFNASNEVAVAAFLNHQIAFVKIEELINRCLDEHKNTLRPNYETLKAVDASIREKVKNLILEEVKQ